MFKKLLFETRLGDWLLAAFERLTGLAVVEVATLESDKVAERDELKQETARLHA